MPPVPPVGNPFEQSSGVRASLENDLPVSIPVGRATAVFCYGHCFHATEEISSLELVIAGRRHRPDAMGMPRRDLYEWFHRGEADPLGHSYRSGFWATLVIPAQDRAVQLHLDAVVALRSGTEAWTRLGQIDVADPLRRAQPSSVCEPPVNPDAIAICLAAFEPDPRLLETQLDSLRAQTDGRWVCVVSDGGSTPERYERMLELIGGDRRFRVSRSEQRLDPYRNFERALLLAPAEAELIALCDQDDQWYPHKLEVLRGAIGSRDLVYSDQRLISGDGRVLRDSLWKGRRNDHENLASLLVANTVPGAAMLFRRKLLSVALPFPDAPGTQYHDHWLALVALTAGEIGYVDEPLYDYVQHGAAVQGAARPEPAPRPLLRRGRGWRGAYFGGYLNRQVWAQALLARCEGRLPRRKRRALTWFIAAERSAWCFAWLAARPLRRVVGRDETLGGEAALAAGIAWRHLIVAAVGRAKTPGRRAYDASFPNPPEFEQRRLRRWRAVG